LSADFVEEVDGGRIFGGVGGDRLSRLSRERPPNGAVEGFADLTFGS
jgi:hypothetical protein